jgi:hypothetical protein
MKFSYRKNREMTSGVEEIILLERGTNLLLSEVIFYSTN